MHSLRSVHPEQSQRQPDLRDNMNRSRVHITVGSREINVVETARREIKNARRKVCLYDLNALQLQHVEDGRRLVEIEA